MFTVMLSFFLSFLISLIFLFLCFFLGKRANFDFEKNSPFECGFDSILSARIPFSMRFFLLTVLFLIFDVEIVLLLPLPLVVSFTFWSMSIFLCLAFLLILFIGLSHEWKEGSLNWVY